MSICGRAENKDDGSVEVVAVGDASSLASYLEALRQGPGYAQVESMESTALEQALTERIFTRGGFVIE